MQRKWVVTDLALAPERDMHTDPDGSLSMSTEVGQLLAYLAHHWQMHPGFEGHTLNCYLMEVYRAIYHTPYWVVPLVLEELRGQRRQFKPAPLYVQHLCGAALTMQRAWEEIGFAHTYRPEEPELAAATRARPNPKPRSRRRRVIIDDSPPPRRKRRVAIDDEDEQSRVSN